MRTVDELREHFIAFFQERGHVFVPPSSLVPDDPSVLLTTAGMQQFKPYYTGERDPERDVHATFGKPLGATRVVSIQPCARTSDIEEVGDATHLTFFEMCGNFAFRGSYFKREAIEYAWQFLSGEVGLPKDRLAVTVFRGDASVSRDEESRAIWLSLGVPAERIVPCGRESNFWGPTGHEGPCGPTTEIHFDRTQTPCEKEDACVANCDCGRWIELWNLVFNEFYADPKGTLTLLSAKGVDTGMGFERLALVVFDAPDVFSTPLNAAMLEWIIARAKRFPESAREAVAHHRLAKAVSNATEDGVALGIRGARIIIDHIRASAFLLFDGILPSNTDRGYILRRLIRRAALYARLLELPQEWPSAVLDRMLEAYARPYPKMQEERGRIFKELVEEIEKFDKTIARGLREFERLVRGRRMAHEELRGADLFLLFETYGFPVELSRELALAEGVSVNVEDLQEVRAAHKNRSRAGAERKFGGHGLVLDTGEIRAKTKEELVLVTRLHTATHLLQAALRNVLGNSVEQRGSDITAERLRFDFSFPRKLTPDEIENVQALVNEKIREDLPVQRDEMPFQDAVASGALAFAKGAYPANVSVYSVAGFSREVCGGPHVARTGEIGAFRITKEEASASGIRRIRAALAVS